MKNFHRVAACVLLASSVTVTATSTAAGTGTTAELGGTDPTSEYLDVLRNAERPLADQSTAGIDHSGTTGNDGRFGVAEFNGINDPQYDVGDPRADILTAAIDMDADGLTAVGMIVVEGTNPDTNIAWWLYESAAAWEIDVNGDGNPNYFAALLNDGIEA